MYLSKRRATFFVGIVVGTIVMTGCQSEPAKPTVNSGAATAKYIEDKRALAQGLEKTHANIRRQAERRRPD